MVRCPLCNKKLGRITHTHLGHGHKMRYSKFIRQFPNANSEVIPWNKGKTKETHPSLAKLSYNLKLQKEWNFSKWQKERRKQRRSQYREFIRNKSLAELIGIILGDGNLYKFPRTENLRIICNSQEIAYIKHIVELINKIFNKKPLVMKRKNENATVISIYQCKLSERLRIPAGNKIRNNVGIPLWVTSDEKYMIKCLKGLFETDGCFVEDKNNYTQIIEFKNNCRRLREDVYNILLNLGFNPQLGRNYVRLARRREVYKFKELIDFRKYNCPLG